MQYSGLLSLNYYYILYDNIQGTMKRKGITGGTEGCQKLIKLLPKLDIDKLFRTYSKFKIYTTL